MKNSSILKLILFGFLCAFLASSCVKEGPMGPAGANGTDGADGSNGLNGVDGNVSCLVCHSTTNLESKRAEFAMSGHSAGAGAVAYAGGRQSCAKCHGHEGFVQYAEFGEVLGNITSPSAWECSTCHGLHQTFESVDYALRLSDPVVPIFDSETTIDLGGNSNLCANCHQSRRAEPNVTNPGEETFRITSTHYGPHHGAQANVLAGVGFAEIPGSVAYPLPGSAIHLTQASCTGCHMAEFSNGEGGHSFKPNLDACNICHGTEIEDLFRTKLNEEMTRDNDEDYDSSTLSHLVSGADGDDKLLIPKIFTSVKDWPTHTGLQCWLCGFNFDERGCD